MECKNVTIESSGKRMYGTLVLHDNYNYTLELVKRPDLKTKAAVAAGTALDNPDEVLEAATIGVLKVVMEGGRGVHVKTNLGQSISRGIEEKIQLLWKLDSIKLSRCKLSANVLTLVDRENSTENIDLIFPSEYQAKRFHKTITKVMRGEKPFIW